MSEDYRWKEMERRMDRVERAAELVPVIQRDVQEIRQDVADNRDETRSLRRALYTTALSIVGGSVLFALTANEIFK
jgi:hypothetical protein